VERLKAAVLVLEKLDPEILPAILAHQRHPGDAATVETLSLLCQKWSREVERLRGTIDEISDCSVFLDITGGLGRALDPQWGVWVQYGGGFGRLVGGRVR